MAMNNASASSKPPGAVGQMSGGGGPQRPDPLIQPALANAMRLGKSFQALAPSGTMGGTPGGGSMVSQPGGPGSMPQKSGYGKSQGGMQRRF